MFFLVVLGLIGAAACEPQVHLPYSYSMMAHHITPYIHEPITTLPMSTGVYPYSYSKYFVPSYDVKSILPKPVEDTPEVKLAKANFALQYQKALMGIHDHTIVRAKRDLTGVMPMHYNMPYMTNSYMMPYNTHMTTPMMTNMHHMYTTPVVHY